MAKNRKKKRKSKLKWIVLLVFLLAVFAGGLYMLKVIRSVKTISDAYIKLGESTAASPTPTQAQEASPEATTEQTATEESQTTAETDENGVTLTFKEQMDAYEQFFNDYYDFLVDFSQATDTASMLAEYADFMTKYATYMSEVEDIDESALSAADDVYYIEVHARILQKAAEATALIGETN